MEFWGRCKLWNFGEDVNYGILGKTFVWNFPLFPNTQPSTVSSLTPCAPFGRLGCIQSNPRGPPETLWTLQYIFHISYFSFHVSYFRIQISYFSFHISDLGFHISWVRYQISEFGFQVRFSIDNVWVQMPSRPTRFHISVFRFQNSDFRLGFRLITCGSRCLLDPHAFIFQFSVFRIRISGSVFD